MTLRLNGDGSGFTEIKAPNAAGDNSITLPTSNGGANQLLQNGGTAGALQYTGAGGGLHYDSSGRLLVGASTARSNFFNSTNSARFQIEGNGSNDNYALAVVSNFAGGTNGAQVILGKSGSASLGGNTLVSDGNTIGRVTFQGTDGSQFVPAAEIRADVNGAPGADNMPGALVFSTNGGSAGPTARVKIDSTGALKLLSGCPGIDFSATQTNGSATPSSETLDSYEEGTFTPSVNGADNSTGYGQRHGRYTKIGNTVYFNIFISLAQAASSANLIITGLPFSSGNAHNYYNAYGRGWNNQWSSNSDNVQWLHASNASQIGAYEIGNTNVSVINITSMGVNGNFILSGHYKVS